MKITVLILSFAAALLTYAHAAEITGDDKSCSAPCAYLNGEIRSGDLKKLQAVFESPTRRHYFVPGNPPMEIFVLQLNSRGGSLEEAMEIGRWIRKSRTKIGTSVKAECFSSCVYILAAGVNKEVFTFADPNIKVGIHRPYLTQMPKEGVQIAVKKALADSKAYFAEMNIPEQLADAMFSIPPDKMEILTDDKLASYRLTGMDIAFEEETQLRGAALYGMTRQEYMQNRALAEEEVKKCFQQPLLKDGSKCVGSVYMKYGLHSSQMKQGR